MDQPRRSNALNPMRMAFGSLFIIETLAGYGLLQRRSTPATIFNTYSPQYFPILVGFGLLWLITLVLVVRPAPRLTALAGQLAGWLRKRWWLTLVLVLGAVEGWYRVAGLGRRVFFPESARRPFMTSLALLLTWAVLIVIFAGRTPDKRRETLFNTLLALISVAVSFWVFSFVYARIIRNDDYWPPHHSWSDLFRVDLRIGYRGRSNLEGFVPPNCPDESSDVAYSFDRRGFRNPPGVDDAPLAVVGSSFTFGICVDYDDMWTTRLANVTGREVANYSVPGAVLWHQNRYTDLFVSRGEHEAILYSISPLTLNPEYSKDYDSSVYERLAVSGGLFYLTPVHYTAWQLFSRSPVTLIQQGIDGMRGEGSEDTEEPDDPGVMLPNGIELREAGGLPTAYLNSDERNQFLEELAEAQDQADRLGIPLVVVTIPSKRSVYREAYQEAFPDSAHLVEAEAEAYEDLCRWVTERGGLCYNATLDMRQAAASGAALYLTTDGHLNGEGGQLFSELVAAYLNTTIYHTK